jgi:hypothetical protein
MTNLLAAVYRDATGGYTPFGWFWLGLSFTVVIGAAVNVAVPKLGLRLTFLGHLPHAATAMRICSALTGLVAIWFALIALTAKPGQ